MQSHPLFVCHGTTKLTFYFKTVLRMDEFLKFHFGLKAHDFHASSTKCVFRLCILVKTLKCTMLTISKRSRNCRITLRQLHKYNNYSRLWEVPIIAKHGFYIFFFQIKWRHQRTRSCLIYFENCTSGCNMWKKISFPLPHSRTFSGLHALASGNVVIVVTSGCWA